MNILSKLSQQTQDVESMLIYGWPTVYDVFPTMIQHLVSAGITIFFHR